MRQRHHIQLIAKQRPFDEAQWQRLLTAFAYVLHEQRRMAGQTPPLPAPPQLPPQTEVDP
ncbi:MAG: hypothetical protein IVW57_19410 [Ktedonobacterales bacterium]|nr:hypothetical protein [Ktedonobacterales bacterium]